MWLVDNTEMHRHHIAGGVYLQGAREEENIKDGSPPVSWAGKSEPNPATQADSHFIWNFDWKLKFWLKLEILTKIVFLSQSGIFYMKLDFWLKVGILTGSCASDLFSKITRHKMDSWILSPDLFSWKAWKRFKRKSCSTKLKRSWQKLSRSSMLARSPRICNFVAKSVLLQFKMWISHAFWVYHFQPPIVLICFSKLALHVGESEASHQFVKYKSIQIKKEHSTLVQDIQRWAEPVLDQPFPALLCNQNCLEGSGWDWTR